MVIKKKDKLVIKFRETTNKNRKSYWQNTEFNLNKKKDINMNKTLQQTVQYSERVQFGVR